MKSFLDSMEMNKLNVLHWHLTDSQSYSLGDKVSRKYGLSEGSLFPGGTYNETDLRGLVDSRRRVNIQLNFPLNFEGLVLGCIDADFCK